MQEDDDDLDFDDDWCFNPASYSHQCSLSLILETNHVKTIYLHRQKSMKQVRRVFKEGIIPALSQGFRVEPRDYPLCYRKWHHVVKGYITSKLFEPGLPPHHISIGYDNEQIQLFFHWTSHHQGPNLPHARAASAVVIQDYRKDSDRDDCQMVSNSKFLEGDEDDWIPLTNNVAKAYAVTVNQAAKTRVNRVQDPSYDTVGVPGNLLNWEQDSGSTAHMTPCRADLFDVEDGQNLGVEVADGHIIKCTTTGKVRINMKDDNGHDLKAVLHGVMYVPGLNKRLLSLTKFADHGHYSKITKGAVILYFGEEENPVTLPLVNGISFSYSAHSDASTANSLVTQGTPVPSTKQLDRKRGKRRLTLELLHKRLGHRNCRCLLAASEQDVWADTTVRMATEEECVTCQISTIKAADKNKMPHTPMTKPRQTIFMDILHLQSGSHLTPDSTFAFLLIMVDAYSRFTKIYGLDDKTTASVIKTIRQYTADCGSVDEFGYIDIEKIRSDAGTQFTSKEFQGFCRDERINLSLAAPKKQAQNHFAERTWQTVNNMARSMIVHARLPDSFLYHAIRYASAVFNILPVKGLVNKDGKSATPAELFHGVKPCIGDFRVFGCPCVLK